MSGGDESSQIELEEAVCWVLASGKEEFIVAVETYGKSVVETDLEASGCEIRD